jgi:hypothetical protein
MNEDDLRQALVIMATAGLVFKHGVFDAAEPWRIADRIIEAQKDVDQPEQEVGIVAVKSRRKKND